MHETVEKSWTQLGHIYLIYSFTEANCLFHNGVFGP